MSMLRNSGNGIHTIGAKSMIASPVGGGNNSRLAMRGQAVVSNSSSNMGQSQSQGNSPFLKANGRSKPSSGREEYDDYDDYSAYGL